MEELVISCDVCDCVMNMDGTLVLKEDAIRFKVVLYPGNSSARETTVPIDVCSNKCVGQALDEAVRELKKVMSST